MNETGLFPYYFPTTVVFVDDNAGFLRGLELKLPEDLAYISYSSPQDAISRVNAPLDTPPLYQRCFSYYENRDARSDSQRLIHLDMSLIEREISNPARFEEVSTVVLDYDMPGIDGLELCRQLNNPRIRKVMLTGVADEKIAVQAFNQRLIDQFITKNDPNAIELIREAIAQMQQAYFREISDTLRASLALDSPGFLSDPEFQRHFRELCQQRSFAEYYLLDDPVGFLLVTDDGDLVRLVMHDHTQQGHALRYAEANGAPEKLVDDLRGGRYIAWFYETIDMFDTDDEYDWSEYCFPAQSAGRWTYALIENPPVDIDFEAEASSYRNYLDRLDESFVNA